MTDVTHRISAVARTVGTRTLEEPGAASAAADRTTAAHTATG
jgi:hypothetical protein